MKLIIIKLSFLFSPFFGGGCGEYFKGVIRVDGTQATNLSGQVMIIAPVATIIGPVVDALKRLNRSFVIFYAPYVQGAIWITHPNG